MTTGQDRALALAIAKQMALRDLYMVTPRPPVDSRQVRRQLARLKTIRRTQQLGPAVQSKPAPRNLHILHTVERGGREFQYHATKGWRSYRIPVGQA